MNAVSGAAAQNACPVTEAARVNTASSIAVIRVLYPTIKATPPAIYFSQTGRPVWEKLIAGGVLVGMAV